MKHYIYVCAKICRNFKLTLFSQVGTCTTLASPHWACFQREPDSRCLLISRVMRQQDSPSSASKPLSTCSKVLWVVKKYWKSAHCPPHISVSLSVFSPPSDQQLPTSSDRTRGSSSSAPSTRPRLFLLSIILHFCSCCTKTSSRNSPSCHRLHQPMEPQ